MIKMSRSADHEKGEDAPSRHHTQIEAKSGSNAFHTGSGDQYVKFGGVWAQAVALIAGVAGASVAIAMAPEASDTQYALYCVLVIFCATTSVVCLWSACDGVRKKLTTFTVLVAIAVAGTALATGSYKLLADHGDVELHIPVPSGGPMKNKDEVPVTFKAPSPRSHLRVKVFIEDEIRGLTCHAHSVVSLMPIVNGEELKGEMVMLMDGQTGEIPLPGRPEHVELRAVVDTSAGGAGCQVNLRFESAVLHDDEWWLL
ncbi:hypothetical protein [Streptomyces sp. NPDC002164]|uniref:hypothetical protein n=1 Tax=Streptomyces sp. NPDC002164 TaxID=3364633 RepID=UPI0036A50C49